MYIIYYLYIQLVVLKLENLSSNTGNTKMHYLMETENGTTQCSETVKILENSFLNYISFVEDRTFTIMYAGPLLLGGLLC